jgi:GT2 family glycosyltransferase
LVNKKDPLAHGSAIIKRSALLKINGYNEKFIYGQDYELWIRMLTLNYRIAMIDDVCYFQRIKFDYNKRQWQKMYAELVDKALYSDINIETDIDKIYNNIINTKSRITIKASIINFWNLVKFKINTCLMNLKQ